MTNFHFKKRKACFVQHLICRVEVESFFIRPAHLDPKAALSSQSHEVPQLLVFYKVTGVVDTCQGA